ncbi:MAG: hypothetical protein JXQ75_15320 [Phycisphaerae bacterium]|nr:hypothetical protein [Phycisphaerae bacterium]
MGDISGSHLAFGWVAVGLFVGYMVLRWRSMSPFRLSVPGIAFTTYILILLIPGLLLAPSQWNSVAAERFVVITVLSGFLLLMGMALCSMAYPAPKIDLLEYIRAPVVMPTRGSWLWVMTFFAVIVVIAVALRYYLTGRVPVLYMLTHAHEYDAIQEARFSVKELGQSWGLFRRVQIYYMAWSVILILPFIVVIAQAMHQTTKRSLWRNIFWITAAVALLLGGWDASKSRAAQMASVLLASALLIRGRITWKLALGVVLVLIMPVALAIIIHPTYIARSQIYAAMFSRAFVTPAELTYQYVAMFPDYYEHTWGRGTFWMGAMLGREPAHIPLMAARYITGNQSTQTYMNCGFIGTGWAEFSYLGVAGYSLMAGGLSQFIQNFVMRRSTHGKKLHLLFLQACQVPLWTVILASAGITQFFVGNGLIPSLVLVWWLGNKLYGTDSFGVHAPYGCVTQ